MEQMLSQFLLIKFQIRNYKIPDIPENVHVCITSFFVILESHCKKSPPSTSIIQLQNVMPGLAEH